MKKTINILKDNIWIIVYTLFLTVFCSIFSLQSPFTHIFPWVDSSAFLYDGLSLTKGLVMYKDFFDHKGPLIFIINYLGINLTGGILGVWVLEVLSLFIFFIFLYKLIKLFSNNFTYILTSLIIMLTLPYFTGVGNFTELFSLPFIMIGLYFLTKYFFKKDSLSKKDTFLIGLSFMACLLLRPNNAAMWFIYCFIIFVNLIYNKEYKKLLNIVLYFLLGMFIMFLPFLIYFICTSSLKDFIYQYIIINFVYIGSSLNLYNLISTIKYFLNNVLTIFIIISFIIIVISKIKNLKKSKVLYLLTLSLSTLFTFLMIIMSGRSYDHYYIIMFPLISIFVSHLISVLYENILNKNSELKLNLSLSLLIIVFILAVTNKNNTFTIYKNNEYKLHMESERQELIDLKSYTEKYTKETDKIISSPFYPEVYFYTGRMANTKYYYQNYDIFRRVSDIREEFLKDVKDKDTTLYIKPIENTFGEYDEFNNEVDKILESEYTLDYKTDFFLIYKHK